MNKKKTITIFIIIIIVVLIVAIMWWTSNQEKTGQSNGHDNEGNIASGTANKTVEELMQDVNATADSEIYEIQTEYDGREVLAVKPSLQFSVAFADTIQNGLTSIQEAQTITAQNLPQNAGIYIKNNENKILEYINNYTNCQYGVSENGFLMIKENQENNDIDNRIQNIINGDNLYIVCCDGQMKMIDNITGEIIDYEFEKMDPYQVYEYLQDENRLFIELTTNKENRLTREEIFMSFLELLELDL